MKLRTYLRTVYLLGPVSVLRAFRYRLGLKLGLNPVKRLKADPVEGPYFFAPTETDSTLTAPSHWHNEAWGFGHIHIAVRDKPPNWHTNILTGQKIPNPTRPWWQIPDFDPNAGDIKGVWEISRFDWVIAFAQQAFTGNKPALTRLNNWLHDWCLKNPPYKGPNWKCGQEASIRVMHLAMASLILRQQKHPSPQVLSVVRQHLRRIAPTITYAIAQNNNHGTSEAAALFIGGSWLRLHGDPNGRRWESVGRKWLENRAKRLIEDDGSFSQYSVNYHRVMLDTYCMAEIWRRANRLNEFSRTLSGKLRQATEWLHHMVIPHNGDAPNIGANDGARLLQLTSTEYRDFRPTVYTASALFCQYEAFSPHTASNDPFRWLGLDTEHNSNKSRFDYSSIILSDGGYAILRTINATVIIRLANFHYRPSHADCLHIDFWVAGENILRDGGTYSYNAEVTWLEYFPGTASHNTIQFDNRDQMPRISRFLYGNWLRLSERTGITAKDGFLRFSAAYHDDAGAAHRREVELSETTLRITDTIQGFSEKAVLRWRLSPNLAWHETSSGAKCDKVEFTVRCTAPPIKQALNCGWESRYYYKKTALPVFEVEVGEASQIFTEFRWIN